MHRGWTRASDELLSEFDLISWFVYMSWSAVPTLMRFPDQTRRDHGYVVIPTNADSPASGEEVSAKVTNGIFTVHSGATNSYSYAYGPGGVAGLRDNPYTLASAVLASIGGLLFGYDQGVIANVLVMRDFKLRWAMTEWQEGIMSEHSRDVE